MAIAIIKTITMYEYYNNILCVESSFLINELGMPLYTYQSHVKRGSLNLIRRGGNGRTALVEFATMRSDIKQRTEDLAGPAKEAAAKDIFESYLKPDLLSANFFISYRKENGKPLSKEKQLEYCTNAIILNAVDSIVIAKATNYRKITGNKARLWETISNAINLLPSKDYTHSIPGNCRSLERAYKRYKQEGCISLIHGSTNNINRRKIVGDVADYLLATYCLPNKPLISILHAMYHRVNESKGWPTLSEQAIGMYLDQPEVKRIWTLARHGKDIFSNEFGHKLSREKSQWFPNVYWAIDGTKLDWVHYQDNVSGNAAQLKINPVFDVFSEMIIGYSLSETENHIDHFTALRSAMNFAQSRPFKLTYDNQSGHKSARMQELYTGLVAREKGVHHPTAPRRKTKSGTYMASSKANPAEGLFNRLQQQVISTFWFSDKQSIKSRNLDNVPNVDFILENKHLLLTKEDTIKAWELAVKMWNTAEHPLFKGKTRTEVYAMPAPIAESVDYLEMIDMFWVVETKPITYKSDGLHLRIAKKEYIFEVYDAHDKIDLEFRKYNIGKRFLVRYDPEQLDVSIQLIEVATNGDKTIVAHAQPKRKHQEIPVLMQDGDKELWSEDYQVRITEFEEVQGELDALRQRTGITPEQLIEDQDWMIKQGSTLPKEVRSKVEESVYSNL